MEFVEIEKVNQEAAPTLVDVAHRAGVNKVTASIVLSGGSGNTRVSEATRQRIVQAAADLHYQPNAVARSLRNRRTHTIGYYMSGPLDMRDVFLSEIASGLQQGCEQNRHDFLMHGTFRGRYTDEVYTHLLNGKIDGLVLHVENDDPLMPRLAASRLPVIAVANPVPDLPSVTVDDAAGSRLIAQHLAGKGHRRIMYAASSFPLTSAIRRHAAFMDLVEEFGLEVNTASTSEPSKVAETILQMSAQRRPTAVVCWNDLTAYRLIQQLSVLGIRVPGDIAVTGFDGFTSQVPPAYILTTVRAPWHEVAKTAVDLLCSANGKQPVGETIFPVELVVGETT